MWRSRMFWRLFGIYGLLWLAAITGLGVFLVSRVDQLFVAQIEERLRARAVLLAEITRQRPAQDAAELQRRVEALQQETNTRITFIAADGTVLADSEKDPRRHDIDNHADRPEIQAARRDRYGVTRQRHSSTVHQEMMYVALRTDDPSGAVAYVRVALSLESIEEQLARLHHIVWTAAAVAAAAGTALTFWLTRRLVRPVRELTTAADRIAAGDYGHRVYAPGSDEVATLARTFNHMSGRLAEQFAQLEGDRQQMRAIFGGMVEGVVALDGGQRILFANERAARLLGFPGQAAAGRKLWEVVRQRSLQELVSKALAGPGPCQEELTWSGPAERSVTVHAARLPGPANRGAVLVLHDTTELRRLERVRRDFVANVSHELKTPLSVIKACIETLRDGAVDDPQHREPFLEQIDDQSERLHALILDLLSLARIESGTEAFDFQAVALGSVVAACLERHRARAEAKNQLLEGEAVSNQQLARSASEGVQPSPLAPAAVAWADEEAVSQILDNLVDNAVKYTPNGGRIRVRWGEQNGEVFLEVTDTGIGIPDRDLPRIFERFYRVDKARSRELGGTGLGLSIVKHLVQAMHGSVRADSKVNEGTTFTVRLPRVPAS